MFIVNKDTIDRCLTRKIVAGKTAVKNGPVVEGTQIIIYNITDKSLYGVFTAASNQYISSAHFKEFTQVVNLVHFNKADVEKFCWSKKTLMPINTVLTPQEGAEVLALFTNFKASATSEAPSYALPRSVTSTSHTMESLTVISPDAVLNAPSVNLSIVGSSTPAKKDTGFHEGLFSIKSDLVLLEGSIIRTELQKVNLDCSIIRTELKEMRHEQLFMRYLCIGLVLYVVVLLFKLKIGVNKF